MKDENYEHCKSIADELDKIASGESFDEDGERVTMVDYFREYLDVFYIVNSKKEYMSCRVLVAYGGPSIYINTYNGKVELYWWFETAEAELTREAIEAIDELFEMIYETA